jgi:predicted nucleic acid-binding protein
VTLVDANVLLYAYHPRAAQHERCRAWIVCTTDRDFARFPGLRTFSPLEG